MTNPVEEGARVVKRVIDDGAFDEIRKNVFEELKGSTVLREYVRELVEGSKTLSADEAKASSKDRKKLLDELHGELKDQLVEKASRVVWEILTKSDGRVSKDIEQRVHEAICRLYEERQQQQQQQQQAAAAASQQQSLQRRQSSSAPGVKPEPGEDGTTRASLPPRAGLTPSASLAGQQPAGKRYGMIGPSS
ncbi:hypothetical protein HYH03_007479 [Edaphochlamys debaryana]|uniref:BOD1/SHG1 domain-containing protein n=1 Tax=Edaphochlamys debaryana TaxID=47281 RepID=A0A836BZY2_9CHLO|nr:hypothetical protein HYH03_007479 [Edaphochlamys debaryana]|eukprot:KAG2494427.1 hypothetical protein HYH03_007479 [Edaphochlamys debaryana]